VTIVDGTAIVPETAVIGVGECVILSTYTACRCGKVPAVVSAVLLRSMNWAAVFVSAALFSIEHRVVKFSPLDIYFCKVCRVYAETCQSSGGSGRRSWQEISQRRRAAAKKAGQNA